MKIKPILSILPMLLLMSFYFSCKRSEIISRNSLSLQEKKQLLRDSFYLRGLDKKLIKSFGNNEQINWQPQWDSMQQVNSSSSIAYFYVPLKPKLTDSNSRPLSKKVSQLDYRQYLLIRSKNGALEYAEAYLRPDSFIHRVISDPDFLRHFTGTVKAYSLESKATKTIKYFNRKMIIPTETLTEKTMATSNSVAGSWQRVCETIEKCNWGAYCGPMGNSSDVIVTYTEGVGGCPYPPYDPVCTFTDNGTWNLNTSRNEESCRDVWVDDGGPGTTPDPGGGSGSGGGSTTPDCDTVAKKGEALTAVINDVNIQYDLDPARIGDIKTLTVEKGFAIYEIVNVDPFDPNNVTHDHYTTDPTITGTDSSINFTINSNSNLKGLVGTLHTHPAKGYSAPSPKDIFTLWGAAAFNSSPFLTNTFQGNFTIASNGDKYAIVVTDRTLFDAFAATESANLEGSKWKSGTAIEKDFGEATDYYKKQFKKTSNKHNLVYENAMAVILDKYKTGVSLLKYNNETGKFEPLLRKEVVTTKDNGKKVTTYTNPCK